LNVLVTRSVIRVEKQLMDDSSGPSTAPLEALRFEGELDSDGLLSAPAFEAAVARHLVYAHHFGRPGALVLLDAGNGSHWRASAALAERLRAPDLAAWIGEREIAIMLPALAGAVAESAAAELVAAIGPGGAAGVASFSVATEPSGRPSALLNAAEEALLAAREAGGGVVAFEPGLPARRRAAGGEPSWAERLRAAMANGGGLVLDAQPMCELTMGGVMAWELFVRLADRPGRPLPPAAFLPAAARRELLGAIDAWVVARALELIEARRALGAPIKLSVNLSAASLADPAPVLRQLAGRAGAEDLMFELPERAVIADVAAAVRCTSALSELGAKLALDGFGAEFGSVTLLRDVPVDSVKLAPGLVRGLPVRDADRAVVLAVVQAAEALGRIVVATGVEDAAARVAARGFGIGFGQGFLLGAPEPAGALLGAG
jgi:EAL domain-containing protein (putative c-di-GMP-specific phosphodiesterase class I)